LERNQKVAETTTAFRETTKMKCTALKRTRENDTEWLIVNGHMKMGRWIHWFGVNCLADTQKSKDFVEACYRAHQDATLCHFEVKEIK